MPIYEYRCENGHLFEIKQRMSDDSLTECTTCGAAVQRVFHPIAVHFKGSGFYNTDYGKAGAKKDREANKGESGSSSSDSKESKDSSSSSDSSSSDSSSSSSKDSSSSSKDSSSSGGSKDSSKTAAPSSSKG
jgi:putative FmdB family regulatory protein